MRDGEVPQLRFACLRPEDLAEIALQPSQQTMLGLPGMADPETAELACAQAVAWCARDGGRIVACFGIVELFAGRQGYAWCMLAEGIGAAHLQLTRFIQSQIAGCGLARLELLARAPDIEGELAKRPGLAFSLAWRKATPEMRWAVLLGFEPAHVLRCYGAASETMMLFERISPLCVPMREAA